MSQGSSLQNTQITGSDGKSIVTTDKKGTDTFLLTRDDKIIELLSSILSAIKEQTEILTNL